MHLDTLPPEDARVLVLMIAPRMGARAETLARLCGYLPYALRVSATTLAEQIDLSPLDYLQRLTDTQQRLGLIDAPLSLSYERLPPELQQQWCLLALFPSLFDAETAAEVLALESVPAQDILSTLVRYSLVEWIPEIGRYALHDLARVFALAHLERTRERAPLQWAMTQHNLGTALMRLGEREAETTRLDEAVQAYRAALLERTRERVPLDWAMTQTNLGTALMRLGEREAETTRLDEAVQAYRAALLEYTRERVPLDWAMTQTNLGNTLATLGVRKHESPLVSDALASLLSAWEVFSSAAHVSSRPVIDMVKHIITILMTEFDQPTWQACLAPYEEGLRRMGLLEDEPPS